MFIPEQGEPHYSIVQVFGEERSEAFRLSAHSFARAFDAQIPDDTEEFYRVNADDGEQVAAFGLNRCDDGMACCHYLDRRSISDALKERFPHMNSNSRLVELCHLGLTSGRVFCALLPQLARFLSKDADVLLCTATSQLAKKFVAQGFAPYCIAPALVSALPKEQRQEWGSYYATNPQVLAGSLQYSATTQGGLHVA